MSTGSCGAGAVAHMGALLGGKSGLGTVTGGAV